MICLLSKHNILQNCIWTHHNNVRISPTQILLNGADELVQEYEDFDWIK